MSVYRLAVPGSGMLSGSNLYAAPIPCQYRATTLVSGCSCDGTLLPQYMTATFTGPIAALGTLTLMWNASTSRWQAAGLTGSEYCGIDLVYLYCFGGNWTFAIGSYSFGISNNPLTLSACSPFSVAGTLVLPGGDPCGGVGGGAVTVTGNVPIVHSGETNADYWLAIYTGWMLSGQRLFAAADCNPDGEVTGGGCLPAGQYPRYLYATVNFGASSVQGSYLLTWTGSNAWQSATIASPDCLAGFKIFFGCSASVVQIQVFDAFTTYSQTVFPVYDPVYAVGDFSGFAFLVSACGTPLTITITSVPATSWPFSPPSGTLPSGRHALYRLATLASGMYGAIPLSGILSGRRLYAAERDPCCDGGPLFSGFPTSGVSSGTSSGTSSGAE